MAKPNDTKIKVFNFCLQAYKETGPDFSSIDVERLAGGTNKQTLLKYYDQFKSLMPVAEAMPNSDWQTWQAVQELDNANAERDANAKSRYESPLIEKIETLLAQKNELDTYIQDLEASKAKLENQLKVETTALDNSENKLAQSIMKMEMLKQQQQHAIEVQRLETDTIIAANTEREKSLNRLNNQLTDELIHEKTRVESIREQANSETLSLRTQFEEKQREFNAELMAIESLNASITTQNEALKLTLHEKIKELSENKVDIALTIKNNDRLTTEKMQLQKEYTALLQQESTPSLAKYIAQFKNEVSFRPLIKEFNVIRKSLSPALNQFITQYEVLHFNNKKEKLRE